MKSFRLFALLIAGMCSVSLAAKPSPKVDTSKIEVSLITDQPTIQLGEPTYLSFVVKNNSDRDLQLSLGGDSRNSLGRPDSFNVNVTGEDGKSVPQPAVLTLGGRIFHGELPASGTYTIRLFLPDWATIERTGRYEISSAKTLQIQQPDAKGDAEVTRVKVTASATIEVLPADHERMGKLIEKYGERFLTADARSDPDSVKIFRAIPDERVIPYYLKALRSDKDHLKWAAVRALSRFNDDTALTGLKEAMGFTGRDIGDATTPEVAERTAETLRESAAFALSESPHPDAIPFLITYRADPSNKVRLAVFKAISKAVHPDKAVPLLEEMADDPDETIRSFCTLLPEGSDFEEVAKTRQPADPVKDMRAVRLGA